MMTTIEGLGKHMLFHSVTIKDISKWFPLLNWWLEDIGL